VRHRAPVLRHRAIFVLASAAALAIAFQTTGFNLQASNFTLRTSDFKLQTSDVEAAHAVHLDVIATDSRGRGVPNLRAADFEVREDGVLRSIDEARFITARPSGADEITNPIDSDASERTEAADVNVRLIGIFLDEYHVDAGNTARVRGAVTRFVSRSLDSRDLVVVMRPLDSLFAIRLTRDRSSILEAIGRFEGRSGDYAARTPYERSFMVGTPARIEQQRAQVATSALNALASHLGNLNRDARKTLIVVSEGLPRVDRRRGLESLPTLDTVIRSANRYNVSIYPVDPRPFTSGTGVPADRDTLGGLASSTDGKAIVAVADLGEAMDPIALDSSAYYVLTYSTTTKSDGRFHEVLVKVKKAGVVLRTRKGYWAPSSDDALRAALLRPRTPPPLEPPRHISPLITAWFGAERGADGKTRMTFVWEPSPVVPGSKRPTPSRVQFKALAADDSTLFDGPVSPTGPLRPDASSDSSARAVFEARPGIVRLRMSIENEAEQSVDSDVRDITVRDLSAAVVLGTPEVFRGRTARDFRGFEGATGAAPVASREFSRTERLMIRVPAYASNDARPTVSARLMNRKGQAIRDLEVQPASGLIPAVIDLPLAGFAVGDYRIELAAASSGAQTKDVLDFRVTN
jgi:VWFA-related protein